MSVDVQFLVENFMFQKPVFPSCNQKLHFVFNCCQTDVSLKFCEDGVTKLKTKV